MVARARPRRPQRRYEEERQIASRREEAELRPVPKISPMAKTLHRSLDDLMVWHERKTQSNRLRQMQASAAEDRQLTFSPSINSKSKYLAAARAFRGELKSRPALPAAEGGGPAPRGAGGADRGSAGGAAGRRGRSAGRRPPAAATAALGIEKDWYGFA